MEIRVEHSLRGASWPTPRASLIPWRLREFDFHFFIADRLNRLRGDHAPPIEYKEKIITLIHPVELKSSVFIDFSVHQVVFRPGNGISFAHRSDFSGRRPSSEPRMNG